jgi:hypothetical protein
VSLFEPKKFWPQSTTSSPTPSNTLMKSSPPKLKMVSAPPVAALMKLPKELPVIWSSPLPLCTSSMMLPSQFEVLVRPWFFTSGPLPEMIQTGAADQLVDTGAAGELVRSAQAVQVVIAKDAIQGVGSPAPEDDVTDVASVATI